MGRDLGIVLLLVAALGSDATLPLAREAPIGALWNKPRIRI
jgi:hypothetical protein